MDHGAGPGATVSGNVEIDLSYGDGGGPGVAWVAVNVDGVELTSFPATDHAVFWQSYTASNGTHEITATATDYNGSVSRADMALTAQNSVSGLSVSPDAVGTNQPVEISGQVSTSAGWSIVVTDCDDNPVWSTEGVGATVAAEWPGADDGGFFTVTATSLADSSSQSLSVAVNATDSPQFLIVIEEKTWAEDSALTVKMLTSLAQRRGLTCKVLQADQATWQAISDALSKPGCLYLYILCHGEISFPSTSKNAPTYPLTHLMITASHDWLYAKPWDDNLAAGSSDPNHPGWKVEYATSLCRDTLPLRFAWVDACFSGYVGAYRPLPGNSGANDPYDGTYGLYSCYETTDDNDMAAALGISSMNEASWACGYVGWYGLGWPDEFCYGGTSSEYPGTLGLCGETFGLLASGSGDGFPFEQARQYIQDEWPQVPDSQPRWRQDVERQQGPAHSAFLQLALLGNPVRLIVLVGAGRGSCPALRQPPFGNARADAQSVATAPGPGQQRGPRWRGVARPARGGGCAIPPFPDRDDLAAERGAP